MNLFAIMNGPGKIARRDFRIEKTMKPGRPIKWHMLENFFYAYNPFTILFQPKRRCDARICAIRSHEISRSD